MIILPPDPNERISVDDNYLVAKAECSATYSSKSCLEIGTGGGECEGMIWLSTPDFTKDGVGSPTCWLETPEEVEMVIQHLQKLKEEM